MVVKRFLEKPAADEVTTNLVNAGVYVLEPEVLGMIPAGREVSIEREIFPDLQASGRLRAHVSSAYWRDIGTPRSYLAASHDVLSGAVGTDREGFEYVDVDPSVRAGKNVKLLPPLSVAADCELDCLATVGGRSSLGRGCRVGRASVIEGSIMLDGAQVEAGAVVRGSIIGRDARVGEGAIVRGLSVLGAGLRRRRGQRPRPGHPGQPRRRPAPAQPEILTPRHALRAAAFDTVRLPPPLVSMALLGLSAHLLPRISDGPA
jgi:mannose-1-phosphate guanylyltransferase